MMKLINNRPKTYFISDLHLGHRKIYDLPFPAYNNKEKRMRDFDTMEDCEQYMIDQYNNTIETDDKVYFLGDIALNKKHLPLLKEMKKGNKYLVLGNHDKFDVKVYREYFQKVYGVLYMHEYRAIVSHMPVHPYLLADGEYKRFSYNIHGHTHDHYVMCEGRGGKQIRDHRYINVAVEATGFRPISAEELGLVW